MLSRTQCVRSPVRENVYRDLLAYDAYDVRALDSCLSKLQLDKEGFYVVCNS